ncbi:hypothetical protein MHYP_G00296640 [Metynnis hypsauchen]
MCGRGELKEDFLKACRWRTVTWCEHASPKCRLLAHLTCPPGSVTASHQMFHLPLQKYLFLAWGSASAARLHLTCGPSQGRWHLGAHSPRRGAHGAQARFSRARGSSLSRTVKALLNLWPLETTGRTCARVEACFSTTKHG